ncbi:MULTISPECIES: glycosyltransferase family 2 protein [Morganellaceae]|uniref:glycosyltransferase family 2 protein n=1 Tax=Morganellaceae TaxID=1903414 RepID=UPI00201DBF54|nr:MULTISPECIES: glycosyltransferase family A protein [Morganellaceae]MCZ4571310.1 glycosyltransferase family A protein [Proteus mirabilis]MCZ4658653.1 glycosyltransferase family A protein [Proteus mirabilis]MCZ4666156.1 glycosyltransferase family A protein [Proteus mirabilis]UQZ12822.1 glycosyltransferase family 2 protein [Providencia stuartii]HEM8303422.1 glycosyltransferase family 2 protein [Providencia stuartii]
MPLVSVIVPVYNTSKYLKKCIDSILAQTLKDIEVIIVNDGSTDDSLSIINQYSDDRIVIINKENGGLSSARNSGIEEAKGDYILHVDSDDWIDADYCLDTYCYAKKNDIDMVITNLNMLWNGIEKEIKSIENLPTKETITNLEYLDFWSKNKVISSCVNRLIRTSLYKDNDILHPENISLGEDLVTTPRLSFYSKKIGIIDKAYYNYIQNPESIMNSGTIRKIYDMINVFSILDDFFEQKKINMNTSYLKAYYYSTLISRKYDVNDVFYNEAISEYICFMKKSKIPYQLNLHSVKFILIKILLNIRGTKNTVKFIRDINCFFISIKHHIRAYLNRR